MRRREADAKNGFSALPQMLAGHCLHLWKRQIGALG